MSGSPPLTARAEVSIDLRGSWGRREGAGGRGVRGQGERADCGPRPEERVRGLSLGGVVFNFYSF